MDSSRCISFVGKSELSEQLMFLPAAQCFRYVSCVSLTSGGTGSSQSRDFRWFQGVRDPVTCPT